MKVFRKIIGFFYYSALLISCRNIPETICHIELNGLDFLYSVRGPEDGKPVVLMHGNGGSHRSMATQQIQLAKAGYRVYCLTSRGQGENEPLEEYHYADMAEDCYCFIKALGLEKPVVGGWSDGGINSLLLEIAHPGTSSMIVAAGANLTPDCGDDFESFKEWILSQGTPLLMMMLNEPNITPEQLASIQVPALVIAGSKDLISVEHTTLIADSIPDSELVIVEGADHGSYIKKNPRLGNYMLDFMHRRGY
ncbi:MAG: alpha/beta hydrolase [Bacteroidales bacterium]|nr:alpha/beta hydrolase [Bacteroidales bacterium]